MNGAVEGSSPLRGTLVLAGLSAALLALGLLGSSTTHARSSRTEGRYAGSEACADCHEDQVSALKMTQHGKAGFAELSDHGCEACHGPAAAHVDDSDDLASRPSNPAKLDASEVSELCTGCHAGGKQFLWMGGRHESRGVSCVDCHSVHSPESPAYQLKKADAQETCFQCHQSVRAENRKPSHHPIREGRIGCGDCHNPHGSIGDKMISAVSINDKCYECHAEKRGPFLWEHAPVRESCMNCHSPHGSNHQKLQRTSTPYLCQQCHSNTRHPGTLYDVRALPSNNRIFDRACLNCHTNIHGTNHPSGPYLGR